MHAWMYVCTYSIGIGIGISISTSISISISISISTRKHPDSPTPLLYRTIGLTLHAIRKIMSHPR